MANQDLSGRKAARARREAQVYGKSALPASRASAAPTTTATSASVSAAPPSIAPSTTASNSGRAASRARRQAMASRGKAAIASNQGQQKVAATRRSVHAQEQKKDCGCGCNGQGNCNDAKTKTMSSNMPVSAAPKATTVPRRNDVKVVSASSAGRINSKLRRQALATHGKTGADIYNKGMSSAQMVRQQNPDISGRELARSVRNQRSTTGATHTATRSVPAGRRRPERNPDDVTGTIVSHSDKTTGDETGLCRSVTGTDYLSSEVFTSFCLKDAPQVPRKVQTTENLRGSTITASGKVGRSENVTGNEQGSCRAVTGNEYVGREQYDDFCKTKVEPGSAKVSFSQTTHGQIVSGSKPARSKHVTGDEAGTCKAVTGTPYAGIEQYREYCDADTTRLTEARSFQRKGNAGRDISGTQPGLAGLTGASKGACRDVSGTAYVGAVQHEEVCGAKPAQIGAADFPQPLTGAPWGGFSVAAPSHASQAEAVDSNVTGTRYEQGRISGTFSMGEGKITGTEQFRFGTGKTGSPVPVAALSAATKESRVTGEGMDVGMKITGNDWNRGERVTGTEGSSAAKRNPTRRGPVSAMPSTEPKRNVDVISSDISVTGGSGNTEKGAPITVSGGARG